MSWLVGAALFARYLLAFVFLASGGSKAVRVDKFEESIQSYRLIPFRIVRVAARCIVAMELLVGVLLLFRIGTVWAGWLAVVLLAVFSLAIGVKLLQKQSIPCGCGGFFDSHEVSGWHLVRNAILAGSAVLVAVMDSVRLGQDFSPGLQAVAAPFALGVLLCLAIAEQIGAVRRLLAPPRSGGAAAAERG